jgi:hypothetical protein
MAPSRSSALLGGTAFWVKGIGSLLRTRSESRECIDLDWLEWAIYTQLLICIHIDASQRTAVLRA